MPRFSFKRKERRLSSEKEVLIMDSRKKKMKAEYRHLLEAIVA